MYLDITAEERVRRIKMSYSDPTFARLHDEPRYIIVSEIVRLLTAQEDRDVYGVDTDRARWFLERSSIAVFECLVECGAFTWTEIADGIEILPDFDRSLHIDGDVGPIVEIFERAHRELHRSHLDDNYAWIFNATCYDVAA